MIVLTYHNVGLAAGDWTIPRETLAAQFEYLKQNGYQPISLQQYLDASNGKADCRKSGYPQL